MQTTRARQSPDNKNRWSAFAAQCPISCLCKIMCRIVNSINLRKCNVILPPKCMDSRPRKKKRFEWKNMNPFCPMMRIDVCDEIWSLMTILTTIIDTNCNQIENMNAKNRWQFNVPQIKCVHTETTARGKKTSFTQNAKQNHRTWHSGWPQSRLLAPLTDCTIFSSLQFFSVSAKFQRKNDKIVRVAI